MAIVVTNGTAPVRALPIACCALVNSARAGGSILAESRENRSAVPPGCQSPGHRHAYGRPLAEV